MHEAAISIAIRCWFPSCSLFFISPSCSSSSMIGWELHLGISFFSLSFVIIGLAMVMWVILCLFCLWDGKHLFVLLGHWISCEFFNPLPYPELSLLILHQTNNGKQFPWIWLFIKILSTRFNLFKLAKFLKSWFGPWKQLVGWAGGIME